MRHTSFLAMLMLIISSGVVQGQGQVYPDQIGEHWCEPNVYYEIHENISPGLWGAIDLAAITWRATPNTSFRLIPAGTQNHYYGDISDDHNTIAFFAGGSSAPAYTRCWRNNCGHIVECDTVLNSNYDFAVGSPWAFDMESVALHEFGHWFEMWPSPYHSPNTQDVMYCCLAEGALHRGLGPSDIAGAEAMYPTGVDPCPGGSGGSGDGSGDGGSSGGDGWWPVCPVEDTPEPDCDGTEIEIEALAPSNPCYPLCDSLSTDVQFTTFQAGCSETTTAYTLGLGVTLMRSFRDKAMKQTSKGLEYVDRYYAHADEALSIFTQHPDLGNYMKIKMYDYMPALRRLLFNEEGGEDLQLTNERMADLQALVDNIKLYASQDLRSDLDEGMQILWSHEGREFQDAATDILLGRPGPLPLR